MDLKFLLGSHDAFSSQSKTNGSVYFLTINEDTDAANGTDYKDSRLRFVKNDKVYAINADKAWRDSDNNVIKETYLKRSGGTMLDGAQIIRNGKSVSWHKGRDSALVFVNSINGYGAIASIKTTNGSWDIGTYKNDSYTDDLLFTYVTDTQYKGSSAVSTAQLRFTETGGIQASKLLVKTSSDGAQVVATNGTKQIWLGVGSAGTNHGIYSDTHSKWIAYADNSGNVHLTGNAATATKLATSRTFIINLANNNTYATFDGSGNAEPGVKGTLGVGNGGTGKSSWSPLGLIYASAATTLTSLGVGTSGQYLKSSGAAAPAWTSFNTVALSWTGGNAAGPVLNATFSTSSAKTATIPSASGTASGVVTTGTQTFGGNKYFTGNHIGFISSSETDKFFDFAYAADPTASTAPGASWRLAALNSGSGDTNYFAIQTGSSSTSATTWNNALRIGMNTLDIAVGGNLYPLTNNTKTLGTSSLKWATIYATTFDGTATHATNLVDKPSLVWTNGTTAGPTLKVTAGNKTSDAVAIPVASSAVSGVVSTTTQTFAGVKTFNNTTEQSGTAAAVKVSGGLYVAKRARSKVVVIDDHVELTYDSTNKSLNFVFV